jgi:hypothetical protein
MKKRILVLLTVMALMVVMLAMSVTPAFAGWNPATGCRVDERGGGDLLLPVSSFPDPEAAAVDGKRTEDDQFCLHRRLTKDQVFVFRFYDNRPAEF